mmetsp:Transcript_4037/g.4130  ORF Transcript_4037/g.4130 Transcript_4037/m.4130 type:complete len:116 (+) Transcript_4037:140-487(+)
MISIFLNRHNSSLRQSALKVVSLVFNPLTRMDIVKANISRSSVWPFSCAPVERFENSKISILSHSKDNVCRDLIGILSNTLWMSSTLKKRRAKMNKHKRKKRAKSLKMNTKESRS